MVTFGILCAMEEEATGVRSCLTNVRTEYHARRTFWIGEISDFTCVVARSGIGKVAAAATTTLLISIYEVDFVINIGLGGGYNPTDLTLGSPSIKCGDVVVASSVIQHDFSTAPFDPPFVLPGVDSHTIVANETLIHVLEISSKAVVGEQRTKVGRVASGDMFITGEVADDVLSRLPDELHPSVFEMELGAVAQICHDFEIPWGGLRSISDVVGTTGQADEYLTSKHETDFTDRLAEIVQSAMQSIVDAR